MFVQQKYNALLSLTYQAVIFFKLVSLIKVGIISSKMKKSVERLFGWLLNFKIFVIL